MAQRVVISETRKLLSEALDGYRQRTGLAPERIGYNREKPNVIWLCSDVHRMQVVLPEDVTEAQVQRVQTKIQTEGILIWSADDAEIAKLYEE